MTDLRLPAPFLSRMERLLGEEFPAFREALERGAPRPGLRVNPLKVDPASFPATFPHPLEPVPWCPEGFLLPEGVRVVIQKDAVRRDDRRLHLVAGWDPDEKLRVSDVARILGVTRYRVWQLIQEGAFPNATRAAPSRPTYRQGIWEIPRQDVYGARTRGGRHRGRAAKR